MNEPKGSRVRELEANVRRRQAADAVRRQQAEKAAREAQEHARDVAMLMLMRRTIDAAEAMITAGKRPPQVRPGVFAVKLDDRVVALVRT